MPERVVGEVEETKAFFVLCRVCETNPAHPWDRRRSDLYDYRTEAEAAREEHDRIYHGLSREPVVEATTAPQVRSDSADAGADPLKSD